MIIMKKLLFILLYPSLLMAQTKEDEAKLLFEKAQSQFENKEFASSAKSLIACNNKLGMQTTKTAYLLVRTGYEGMREYSSDNKESFPISYDNYVRIYTNLKWLFANINKSTYPPEKYKELLEIKLDVEEKIKTAKLKKQFYLNLKSREEKFLADTAEVLIKGFVEDFNEGLKKQPKRSFIGKNYGQRPALLEFAPTDAPNENSIKRFWIKVYDSKNLKDSWHGVYSLNLKSIDDKNSTSLPIAAPARPPLPKEVFTNRPEESMTATGVNYAQPINPTKSIRFALDNYKNSEEYNIHYYHNASEGRIDFGFNLTPYISKIEEFKRIMETTGFYDYYQGYFDDVKDLDLNAIKIN